MLSIFITRYSLLLSNCLSAKPFNKSTWKRQELNKMILFLLFISLPASFCCVQDLPGVNLITDYLHMKHAWCIKADWSKATMKERVDSFKLASLAQAQTRILVEDMEDNLQGGKVIVQLKTSDDFLALMNETDHLEMAKSLPILIILPVNVSDEDLLALDADKSISINYHVYFYNNSTKVLSEAYWLNNILVQHDLALVEEAPLKLEVLFALVIP